jgi:hypothetical protein
MTYKLKLLFLFIFSLFTLGLPGVQAFDSVAGSPVHQEITLSALGFLKADILQAPITHCELVGCTAGIVDGNDFGFDASERNDSRVHFDSCNFSGASEYIRSTYDLVLGDILEGDIRAPEHFGNLLHTVQDFYAHTNWVELGNTRLLFVPGVDEWPILMPFSSFNGVIIVQTTESSIMDQYTLARDQKIVWVNDVYPGLISGATNTFDGCPSSIRLGHWDAPPSNPAAAFTLYANHPNPGEAGFGHGLNKDSEKRGANFGAAYDLAFSQTRQEFCRLINLVAREVSMDKAAGIFHSWVEDKERAIAECAARGWSDTLIEGLTRPYDYDVYFADTLDDCLNLAVTPVPCSADGHSHDITGLGINWGEDTITMTIETQGTSLLEDFNWQAAFNINFESTPCCRRVAVYSIGVQNRQGASLALNIPQTQLLGSVEHVIEEHRLSVTVSYERIDLTPQSEFEILVSINGGRLAGVYRDTLPNYPSPESIAVLPPTR